MIGSGGLTSSNNYTVPKTLTASAEKLGYDLGENDEIFVRDQGKEYSEGDKDEQAEVVIEELNETEENQDQVKELIKDPNFDYLTQEKLEFLNSWTSGVAGHTFGTWGTGN